MRYTIRVAQRAESDIDRAASWIGRHVSHSSAESWHARIVKAIQSLASKPERCPEADEAVKISLDLRVLLSGRHRHIYRILFTIDGSTVNVLRVLHAARDHVDADDL